jgi:peroxiredoxin
MTTKSACALLLSLSLASMTEAGKFNRRLSAGDPAPGWSDLVGIDGKPHALADYDSKLLIVIFTCNQCPVATGYQTRIKQLASNFADRGVSFVAINANPGKGETLEKMSQRSKKAEFPFDYLKDESQAVAKSYGVRTTPTYFVLDADRKIVYLGALDDNAKSADSVERHYLRDAIEAALAGRKPDVTETRSTGCLITYADDE